MFGINLDRKSQEALPRQLYHAIVSLILGNHLQAGVALPSTREMAKSLGISRNTVAEAYEMLRAEGYITCRQAAVCRVNENLTLCAPESKQAATSASSSPAFQLHYDFRMGIPDLTRFPFAAWRNACKQAHESLRRQDYLYGWPQGYLPLREEIVSWLLRSRGLKVAAEDVFITTGTTQAVNLAVSLLAKKKGTFILENPCYFAVVNALQRHGTPYLPIDVDAHGMRVENISNLQNVNISGVYVTPSHQFPFGGVLSAERRIELVCLARKHNSYILEDDYDGEFRYGGSTLTPLYDLEAERVLYMGTFSKSLFPALRIGFAIIPRTLHQRWLDLRNAVDRQSSTLEQATLAAFFRTGKVDRHIRTMSGVYAKKLATLIASVRQYFPATTHILGEKAGIHVAIQVPGAQFDSSFREHCAKNGIGVSPCRFYAFDEEFCEIGKTKSSDILLLGYGNIAEGDINEGIKVLSELIVSAG